MHLLVGLMSVGHHVALTQPQSLVPMLVSGVVVNTEESGPMDDIPPVKGEEALSLAPI